MSNLVFLSAYQLAEMIRNGVVSAVEVLDAHLIQIAKHNPQLNAICTLNEEHARQQAKHADEALARGENWGILHGVPITIKDVFETTGLRTTAGYKPLENYIPDQDATVVARLRAAGAIIMGKTNLAELASDWQGINDLFPRVNNPWNLNYTSGGSSSGSAAAIAAGLSPLDIGDDFGGSIRQPAHFCGIFGLKPTDRRVPTTGHIPELPGMPKCIRQILTVGPLARSVQDLRLCLQLIAGEDLRQPEIPPVPLDTPTTKSLENLRIAWTDEFRGFPVAVEIKQAMESVANHLNNISINTEKWHPNFDFVAAWQISWTVLIYSSIYASPVGMDINFIRKKMGFMYREGTTGDRSLRKLGNVPKMVFPIFFNPNLKDYFEALTERDYLIAKMDRELAQWDVWLCPVAMTPAFTHCSPGEAVEVDGRKIPYMMASGAYTQPLAFTGHPVVVIPIGKTKNGLPIGMQIVGKRWQEMELLRIAEKFSQLITGFQQPPNYN
ncbi:MAG: amidase [Nostocaceae cyanobacterium]|nr:amidase [Nostocaceae cyanobacterium]